MNASVKAILSTIKKAVLYNYFIDVYESSFNLREDLIPPRRMIFVGGGDFRKTGNEFLDYFINLAELKPSDAVLDVGCGIGRMAVPFRVRRMKY